MSSASIGAAVTRAPGEIAADREAALSARLRHDAGLTSDEAAALAARWRLRSYVDGEEIVREGAQATALHWVLDGAAVVCRDTAGEGRLRLLELEPGEVIGEIAFLRDARDAAYSATVIAHRGMSAASIDYDALRRDPSLRDVNDRLTLHFGRLAADRLSATTALTAETLSAAVARERRLARHLGVVIMVMALFIVFSNSRLDLADAAAAYGLDAVGFTSLFHYVLVCLLGLLFRWLIRALDEPPAALGLQLEDWPRQLAAGLLWSLPGLAAGAALRAWLFADEPVLSVHALAARDRLLTPVAFLLLAGYVLVLCPVQEFVTRAGVQAPVLNAFGRRHARLGALVSTLVAAVTFGAMHVGYGVVPVLVTTLAGIYWGIAFVYTRSVLAISISHVVLGVAAFYWFGLIR